MPGQGKPNYLGPNGFDAYQLDLMEGDRACNDNAGTSRPCTQDEKDAMSALYSSQKCSSGDADGSSPSPSEDANGSESSDTDDSSGKRNANASFPESDSGISEMGGSCRTTIAVSSLMVFSVVVALRFI